MDAIRKDRIEARQLINRLTLVCRQTITFLDGKSAMDERKMRRSLQDAVTEANRFLMHDQ